MNTKNLYKCLLVAVILFSANFNGFSQEKAAKINYTSFTVNAVNKKVMIDWKTDNKSTTNYFEIQRSVDGINFHTIELVMGPDPLKTDGESFEGFDIPSKNNQKYYYRLKHVALDGSEEFSETRMLALK